MAKEWYLMRPPYSQTSGFEEDVLDYSNDGFMEALDSPISIEVEYCNPDLSVCVPIRAIIEGSVQDTKLNTLKRQLLVQIGTVKSGWYIRHKNRYWLITGLVDDNKLYEKAVLSICNWKLSWKNENGDIVERWCNVESASQYNNGQRENKTYTIRTDQLMIGMPDDNECLLLDSGQRFIIDKRITVYEENIGSDVDIDISNKVVTYQLTRNDSVLYNYTDSGHYQMLVTQDEQHNGDGFYRIDGKGYWLCLEKHREHFHENTPSNEVSVGAEIIHDSDQLYIGLGAVECTAVYYDENGDVINKEAEWELNCDFTDKLEIDYINNTICISANDISLLNKSFELSLKDYEESKIRFHILGLI